MKDKASALQNDEKLIDIVTRHNYERCDQCPASMVLRGPAGRYIGPVPYEDLSDKAKMFDRKSAIEVLVLVDDYLNGKL